MKNTWIVSRFIVMLMQCAFIIVTGQESLLLYSLDLFVDYLPDVTLFFRSFIHQYAMPWAAPKS